MTTAPAGLRFVRDPDLSRVSRLMQASWAEPCWSYDEPLLAYHLRRPSIEPDLLLGLEEERSGELVAYYAHMPLELETARTGRRAVFGSFLTAAPHVRRGGAARAIQVSLLEESIRRGYEQYLAFCEAGAVSNESIARSCASLGLVTRTLATVAYLALPAAAVARRALPASGRLRRYQPEDETGVDALLHRPEPEPLVSRHDRRDYPARFTAPIARTYVLPSRQGIAAMAHLVLPEVRDAGRRFRNAYLRDFAVDDLEAPELRQFVSDVLCAVAAEGCDLVVAASRGVAPLDLLAGMGFRQTNLRLNLLATSLRAEAALPPLDREAGFRLDVF